MCRYFSFIPWWPLNTSLIVLVPYSIILLDWIPTISSIQLLDIVIYFLFSLLFKGIFGNCNKLLLLIFPSEINLIQIKSWIAPPFFWSEKGWRNNSRSNFNFWSEKGGAIQDLILIRLFRNFEIFFLSFSSTTKI